MSEDKGDGPKKPLCFSRIDFMARPKKHIIMATFQRYYDLFPPSRIERMKLILQELFALRPDEAEKYFNEVRLKAEEAAKRRKIRMMVKAVAIKEKKRQRREKAYQRAQKIIERALMWAAQHETPPIVSIRLRHLSDIILEQLCDLMDLSKPDRANKDKCSMLLMTISDWIAIEIEQIYFKMRLQNTHDLSNIEWAYRQMVMNLPEDFGEPLFTSSRIDARNEKPMDYPDADSFADME